MPKSRNRQGFGKRKRHNRLMLEHSRHSQQKTIERMFKSLNTKPANVAEMLNEEEQSESEGNIVVGASSDQKTITGN